MNLNFDKCLGETNFFTLRTYDSHQQKKSSLKNMYDPEHLPS